MRNTTTTSILGSMLMLAAGEVFAQDVNLARGKPCKVFSSLETSDWGTVRLTDGRNAIDGVSAQSERIVRGGSWRDRPFRTTSSFRLPYRQYQRVYNVGFRVILEDTFVTFNYASDELWTR